MQHTLTTLRGEVEYSTKLITKIEEAFDMELTDTVNAREWFESTFLGCFDTAETAALAADADSKMSAIDNIPSWIEDAINWDDVIDGDGHTSYSFARFDLGDASVIAVIRI